MSLTQGILLGNNWDLHYPQQYPGGAVNDFKYNSYTSVKPNTTPYKKQLLFVGGSIAGCLSFILHFRKTHLLEGEGW